MKEKIDLSVLTERQKQVYQILENRGITQSWLAKKLNMAKTTLSYHLLKASEMDRDLYEQIMSVLGGGNSEAVSEKFAGVVSLNSFPLITQVVSGMGNFLKSMPISERASFDYPFTDQAFALRVIGDSMNSIIAEGDIILVDMRPELLTDNKICVCLLKSGEQLIKRYRKISDSLMLLYSDSSSYAPRTIKFKDVESIYRVVKVSKSV